MLRSGRTTRSRYDDVLDLYRAGHERGALLYGLRKQSDDDEDVPYHVIEKLLSDRKTGRDIVLPTLVGPDIDVLVLGANLCKTEPGETCAAMILLDESVKVLIAYNTEDDDHATLMLTCARHVIEGYVLETRDREEDEEGGRWVPLLFPTTADFISGGTGFPVERLAAYMASFEPDEDGLWFGEQVVAATLPMHTDSYQPEEPGGFCLDPGYEVVRSDGSVYRAFHSNVEPAEGVPILPVNSTVCTCDLAQNRDGDKIEAAHQFRELMYAMYEMIEGLDDLPIPGALRRRRERHPAILLRCLVQSGRAVARRDANPREKFIFHEATDELFELIVRSL